MPTITDVHIYPTPSRTKLCFKVMTQSHHTGLETIDIRPQINTNDLISSLQEQATQKLIGQDCRDLVPIHTILKTIDLPPTYKKELLTALWKAVAKVTCLYLNISTAKLTALYMIATLYFERKDLLYGLN